MNEFYEVLPNIIEEGNEDIILNAAFTSNNGIRVQIHDKETCPDYWISFDFTDAQAEMIGQALVRWAQRSRAETELIRCNRGPVHHK